MIRRARFDHLSQPAVSKNPTNMDVAANYVSMISGDMGNYQSIISSQITNSRAGSLGQVGTKPLLKSRRETDTADAMHAIN